MIQNWADAVNKLDGFFEFVCEMANKFKEETGLPMNIWIDETSSYVNVGHGKRIKFQLNKAERFENANTASMDLNGRIYPADLKIQKLRAQDLEALRNFVRNNRYALEKIADQEIRVYQIWPDIIKGGKAASAKAIAALKAIVDKLVAENKAKGK